jgi:hypothetical protein
MRSSKLAEAAALLEAYDKADGACSDAEYLSYEEDPDLAVLHAACKRLREIRVQLLVLNVHKGTEAVQ